MQGIENGFAKVWDCQYRVKGDLEMLTMLTNLQLLQGQLSGNARCYSGALCGRHR